MPLLVRERNFCDFVLYAEQGPISIERIYRNEAIIEEILSNLTTFWLRVVAPEFFKIRVPRGLNPSILPTYITTWHIPVNNCPHTSDELDIADVLVNLPDQDVPTVPTNPINNLVVVPWGGETSTGITLSNTCPLDNWKNLSSGPSGEQPRNGNFGLTQNPVSWTFALVCSYYLRTASGSLSRPYFIQVDWKGWPSIFQMLEYINL